jgi:hypothetical protein
MIEPGLLLFAAFAVRGLAEGALELGDDRRTQSRRVFAWWSSTSTSAPFTTSLI